MSEKIPVGLSACLSGRAVLDSGEGRPQIDENELVRIYALHELYVLHQQGLTRAALIAWHSRYKLLMLAHSQPEYRQLGPFVAAVHEWDNLEAFFTAYRQRVAQLLSHRSTRRNHTNVLMHVQGYFRQQLTHSQRRELTSLIDAYRCGTQPLLAPLMLIKHYMRQYPHLWLSGQRYFELWPAILRLRTER